jgi:hypothetical protein
MCNREIRVIGDTYFCGQGIIYLSRTTPPIVLG